jgi:hypothetical protein
MNAKTDREAVRQSRGALDAWYADIRAATGWLRLQLIHDLKKLAREGKFDGQKQ